MNRRFGPSLLFVSILALLLLPHVSWCAPQVAADAAYAKKIEAMLPPQVECIASSPTVATGQSITLTARVQKVSAGLVYSFSSDGGRLYPDGPMARLDTTGVAAGRTISATCQATNGAGRRGSGSVAVHVIAMQIAHVPLGGAGQTQMTGGHASVATAGHAEMKAEKDAGGNGASPPKQAHHMTAYDVVTQSKQEVMDQPAPAPPPMQQPQSYQGSAGASPASAAAAAPPTPVPSTASGGDPYQQAKQVLEWKNDLKNGKIDYLIPPQMKLHEATVVKVVVHGYADASQNNMPGATTGILKVSPRMQMQLTAEDNPDEFEIDPKAGQIQFVPIDGSATWMWNVTPKQPAQNQRLTIRALLVYPDNGQQIEQEITSYVATVSVSVPGFWESVREEFWNNPSGAIKYVLPGGAGFTVAAGLIVWWWKRRHPEEDKPKKDE